MRLDLSVNEATYIQVNDRPVRVDFPLPVVAELEKQLSHGMKLPADWFRMETHEVPTVLEAGLKRYHPDDAKELATAICDVTGPEGIGQLMDLLCAAAWPKFMARMQEQVEKSKAQTAGELKNAGAVPPEA